jgi:hypothetical protein
MGRLMARLYVCGGEVVFVVRVEANVRVIGGNVGRSGRNRHRTGKAHLLPAAGGFIRKGCAA